LNSHNANDFKHSHNAMKVQSPAKNSLWFLANLHDQEANCLYLEGAIWYFLVKAAEK
jgi:hypothetical protein